MKPNMYPYFTPISDKNCIYPSLFVLTFFKLLYIDFTTSIISFSTLFCNAFYKYS